MTSTATAGTTASAVTTSTAKIAFEAFQVRKRKSAIMKEQEEMRIARREKSPKDKRAIEKVRFWGKVGHYGTKKNRSF